MGSEQSRPEDENAENEKLREIVRMDEAIRNKVRSGVQYNMKIIVRGERGVGKTTLWRRFQGMQFVDKYVATPEIQSATINWSYRNGEDNVKVDVWDVVDKAIKPKSLPKMEGQFGRHNFDCLDASIVDVYKDASAVTFLVNPRSISSLQYVRELAKDVPLDIVILVVYNFRDLISESQPGVVSYEEVEGLCHDIQMYRSDRRLADRRLYAQNKNASSNLPSAPEDLDGDAQDVFVLQTSMFNCFGLFELNQFLDIPFLQLKQRSLRQQLLQARKDLVDSAQQLHINTAQLQDSYHYSNFAANHQRLQQERQLHQPQQPEEIEAARMIEEARAEEEDRSQKLSNSLQMRRQDEQQRAQAQLKKQSSLKLDHHSQSNGSSSAPIDPSEEEYPSQRSSSTKRKELKIKSSSDHNKSNTRKSSSKTATMAYDSSDSDDKPSSKGTISAAQNSKSQVLAKKDSRSVQTTEKVSGQNAQHFEQEVATFAPLEQGLENFLEISDDEERMMQQQKDKVRSYILSKQSSASATNGSNSIPTNRPDKPGEEEDDGSDDARFVAKKSITPTGRLQAARRIQTVSTNSKNILSTASTNSVDSNHDGLHNAKKVLQHRDKGLHPDTLTAFLQSSDSDGGQFSPVSIVVPKSIPLPKDDEEEDDKGPSVPSHSQEKKSKEKEKSTESTKDKHKGKSKDKKSKTKDKLNDKHSNSFGGLPSSEDSDSGKPTSLNNPRVADTVRMGGGLKRKPSSSTASSHQIPGANAISAAFPPEIDL